MTFLNYAEGTASSVDLHTENKSNTEKETFTLGALLQWEREKTALQNIWVLFKRKVKH